VIIRAAGMDDVTALSALARRTYADAFGHSFSPSDLAAHLESNLAESYFRQAFDEDVFLLAETEGRLIGFVQFGPLRIAVPAAFPQTRNSAGSTFKPDSRTEGSDGASWMLPWITRGSGQRRISISMSGKGISGHGGSMSAMASRSSAPMTWPRPREPPRIGT